MTDVLYGEDFMYLVTKLLLLLKKEIHSSFLEWPV